MAQTHEPTVTANGPELYVRINITKQAKGYVPETTVSARWIDLIHSGREGEPEALLVRRLDIWGDTKIDQPANLVLRELLEMADAEARREIARRESEDAITAAARP